MTMTVVISGPASVHTQVQSAVARAGLTVLDNRDAKGIAHPQHNWGHPDSHETEWTGARWELGDIAAIGDGCTCRGQEPHAHEEGDLVWGTGEIAPKKTDQAIAFVTVEGENLPGWDEEGGAHLSAPSRAHAAVEPLGWRLRSQWNVDTDIQVNTDEMDPLDRLARVESDTAILRTLLLKAGE